MSSSFGKTIHIQLFGQSHSEAIGVVIDGLPAGVRLDMDYIQAFLARRTPGQSDLTTSRKEADIPESLKGMPISLITAALMSVAFLGFTGLL